jgi:reactive intermediate/imine deaminase
VIQVKFAAAMAIMQSQFRLPEGRLVMIAATLKTLAGALAVVLATSAAADAGAAATADAALVYHNKGNDPSRPFSLAVRAGDVVYLSGQLGTGPNGLAVGMEAQARQAMDNIAAVLKDMNLGMDRVFKCTVMLADMAKWGDFNKVYVNYFQPGHMPARSAFGANGLALNAEVEVECMAYAPQGKGHP